MEVLKEYSRQELEQKPKYQLRSICRDLNIKGYTGKESEELIEEIIEAIKNNLSILEKIKRWALKVADEFIKFTNFVRAIWFWLVIIILPLSIWIYSVWNRNISLPIPPGDEFIIKPLSGLKNGALVFCPPGEFLMGSPYSEFGRDGDETPHVVSFENGFWISQTEVTQAQWKSVMGNNPSRFKDDGFPVDSVSWEEVQVFLRRLNQRVRSHKYRLPTEAEWEYAYRADTQTPFHTGATLKPDAAHFAYEYPYAKDRVEKENKGTPVKVKSYPPNAWGIYDMHGNVWEWSQDWYCEYFANSDKVEPKGPKSGTKKVVRGGSWLSNAKSCRSAGRRTDFPSSRQESVGFRLVEEIN